MKTKTKIYVTGGSNCIIARGWVFQLSKLPIADVHTLAVGASSSLMGAFRTIFSGNMTPGSTLIWEYALNDALFLDEDDFDPTLLLRWVEYTILHCKAQNIRMIGLILTPGNREKVVEMDAYRIALLQLFAHHSVETIELSTLYRAELDVPVLPPEVYKGNNHFHSDGVVYPFIVEKVVAQIERTPPTFGHANPIYVRGLDDLSCVLSFEDATVTPFTNNLLSIDTWEPVGNTMTTAPMTQDVSVLGVACLIALHGGAMELRAKDWSVTMSMARKPQVRTIPLLQMMDIAQNCGPLIVKKDEILSLNWLSKDQCPPLTLGSFFDPDDLGFQTRAGRVCGILLETL